MPNDTHDRAAFHFLERLAERGVSYAGTFLEGECRCAVRIVDQDGEELFVSAGAQAAFSQDASRVLSCDIPLESGQARIELAPVDKADAERLAAIVEDVKMPLAFHLASHRSIKRKIQNLRNDLSARLFKDGGRELANYLRLTGQPFDEDASYFVTVTRNNHTSGEACDWGATTEAVRCYLDEHGATDVVDIGIDEGFVHLFPREYALGEQRGESSRHYDIAHHKAVHDRKNGIVTSVGIGRPYPFDQLEKSYREANLALELGWLTGKSGAVVSYADMRLFTLLLDGDHRELLAHCERMLKPLLDFEATHGTPLLDTLRTMLDTTFRWTEVSRLMFIHVNTLRYRMDKISELLGEDFTQAPARANCYFVVKLYDLLRAERF